MSNEIYKRSGQFDVCTVDEEKRTVEISFSSEEPVRRSFGMEVLSHRSSDADFSLLNNGAPLLLEHDIEQVIGVVENAHIDSSKRGRATVRFSRSEEGEKVFRDVIDGIRRNVSCAYSVTDMKEERSAKGTTVRVSWRPREISFVSIPADWSVGVNRAAEADESNLKEIQTMDNKEVQNEVVETRAAPTVDVRVIESKAVEQERSRIAAITDLARKHNAEDLGAEFVRSGKNIDEFRAAVLDTITVQPKIDAYAPVGMSTKEVKEFSLGRAFKAMVGNDWTEAGLELEAIRAAAKQKGESFDGSRMFVPADYLRSALDTTAGAARIENKLMVNNYIDLLFAESIVPRLGVNYIGGLRGTYDIPRTDSGFTTHWIDEDEAADRSRPAFSTIPMSPKTLSARGYWTRRQNMQDFGVVEGTLRQLIQNAIADSMEKAIFAAGGNGVTGAPKGFLNADYAGIFGTLSGGAVTREALLALRKQVAKAHALNNRCKFVTSIDVGTLLENTQVVVGDTPSFLRNDENGKVIGYECVDTTHVPADLGVDNDESMILFGDFSNFTVGSWGNLELEVYRAQDGTGGWNIEVFTDVDFAITRQSAFAGYKTVKVG